MLLLSFTDFFFKNSFRNTIRMLNSLASDQARWNVSPVLEPNCLRNLSVDDENKEF